MTLASGELAAMRQQAANLLLGSESLQATIQRKAETIDDYGGSTTTTSTIATVNCRLANMRREASQFLSAERETEQVFYMLSVAHDTDIQANDIVTINSVDYNVKSLWSDHSDRVLRQAIIEAVT